MDQKEFFKKISIKSEKIGINLDEQKSDKLYNYMNLLLKWNENINLTAITDKDEIILKHFIDSLTINKYIKSNDMVMDIGTGAGFPGIPLRIMNDDNKIILVDSLNKRINFLNEVCNELNLENVECIHSRAEDLACKKEYRENLDVVVSRAVARLNILLEYMLPFVKVGGKCICMKGPNISEELNEATNAIKILGGKIEKIEKVILPESDMERNIVIISKEKTTPSKYPRKSGVPSKQPIL